MADQSLVRLASRILEEAQAYETSSGSGMHLGTGELFATRNRLRNLVGRFEQLLVGPMDTVCRNEIHHIHLFALNAIHRFQIAAQLPDNSTYPFSTLALKCGLSEGILARIVRYAISMNIFIEPQEGFVRHNDASRALTIDKGCEDMIGCLTNELWPAAAKASDALAKWPDSQEPNETGFNIAFDTSMTIFQFIGSDSIRSARFGGMMGFMAAQPVSDSSRILDFLPIQKLLEQPNQKVVDIGGGSGNIAKMLLQRSGNLSCIVQDHPGVIGKCTVPEDLQGRLAFMPHDFFQDQPVKYADAYLFRNVLHNWADKYAIRILRALVPAMKANARVLIHEYVLPSFGKADMQRERYIRSYDLAMLSITNGKERDEEAWINLLQQADTRFRFVQTLSSGLSYMSLIQIEWDESVSKNTGS